MIVKVDDVVQVSPRLDLTAGSTQGSPKTSSQHSSPDKQGVSGDGGSVVAPPWAGSMDDVQSVGSSLGKSSHSSHSRHSHTSHASHASSSRRHHTRAHSNVERVHANGERHRKSSERVSTRQRTSRGTPPCGREEKHANNNNNTTGVDKAEVASMYLDTKQNMLEIIEEGLHMKLELKNIKQQFLSLLENYDTYQTRAPPAPPAAMKAAAGVPLTEQPLSAPRARVKALYEARRARLNARRSVSAKDSSLSSTAAPRRERRSLKDSNKENQGAPRSNILKDTSNALASDQKYNRKLTASTPYCKPHRHCACHPRTTPGSSPLAPIKEEALRQRPPRGYRSGLNSGTATSQTLSDLEGEYVTLRSPSGEGVQSMEVSMEVDSVTESRGGAVSPGALYHTRQSELTQQDQTSIWINTNDNLDALNCPPLLTDDSTADKENMCVNTRRSDATRRRESPIKYASSDVISELYTSKSLSNLKDVSQISRLSVSSQTLREQSSGSNISGNLHSTFNYPLHSTLMYPLHSTLNLSGDEEALEEQRRPIEGPQSSRCFSDVRTTISEPSVVLRKRQKSSKDRSTRRAVDDSIVDIRSLQRSDPSKLPMTTLSTASEVSRRNKSRTARTRRRERLKQREREAAMTPLTSREPQLCKEHGLHPTFGGPCIFQTDDSFTMSETTTEDDADDDVRPRSSTAVTETDNDSSYLSECVDDCSSGHFGPASGRRAEDYTATYDARNGRMRMLRRQTGQTVLDQQQLRDPIGLSESDFLMDVTRKHLSLEATRSSLPDLSALSTTTNSECGADYDDPEADVSEDTLHASQAMKDSDGFWSPNSLDDTVVSVGSFHLGGSKQQRPLSISTSTTTSTTESPESTESRDMPVPVNSPNVTDSGSSRPTTDTYDYVDVPKFEIMGPPVGLPPRHHHQNTVVRRRHHQPGTRPPCTVGRQATASSSSSTAGENNAGSDTGARYETRSEGRGARKCLRYHHDYDSGFSTPGSGRRHILLSDSAGNTRTVVQHSAVASKLPHDRKKQLVKKIKQFSNNFYKSTGNLHIHTLGHF